MLHLIDRFSGNLCLTIYSSLIMASSPKIEHITLKLNGRVGLATCEIPQLAQPRFGVRNIRAQPGRLQRVLGGRLGKVKSSVVLDVYPTAPNQMLTMKISLNRMTIRPVSYTHLTLPTILLV